MEYLCAVTGQGDALWFIGNFVLTSKAQVHTKPGHSYDVSLYQIVNKHVSVDVNCTIVQVVGYCYEEADIHGPEIKLCATYPR